MRRLLLSAKRLSLLLGAVPVMLYGGKKCIRSGCDDRGGGGRGGGGEVMTNIAAPLPEYSSLSKDNLSSYFDHTILKADATHADVSLVCSDAIKYNFAAVCVNSSNVSIVAEELRGSCVKVCAVVGFPLGAMASPIKAEEAFYCGMNGMIQSVQ